MTAIFEDSIAISSRWFHIIKKDYSDWKFAWAREAGQNSLDAGATRIDITVDLNEHGNTDVTWADNGCGMSETTLRTKFMAIGESEKPEGGTGGFGVAKLILAFAQMSYSIRTQDIKATGCGGRFTVKNGLKWHKGLTLAVTMEGDEAYCMKNRIKRWVKFTTTKCAIYLNGEQISTLKLHRPKLTTDWCKVYTHKADGNYACQIRVRINRQYMFNIYTSVDAQIIVDLIGSDSQAYLTSNRDGMNYEWKDKLQKLVEELYQNPNAIKAVDEVVELYCGTDGKIDLETKKVKKARVKLGAPPPVRSVNDPSVDGMNPTIGQQSAITAENKGSVEFKTAKELIDGYDIVVSNATSKKIPEKFIPGKMNKPMSKLMNRWIRVLETVGLILGRTEEVCPGWTFDSGARAMYRHHPQFGHMILLNPVDIMETKFVNYFKGKSDLEIFYEIVCVAVHEITHIDQRNHNNGFAADITYSMAKVLTQWHLLEIVRLETAKA